MINIPFTKEAEKVLKEMEKQYRKEKGKRAFYVGFPLYPTKFRFIGIK